MTATSLRGLQRGALTLMLGAVALAACADKDPADTGKTTKTSNDGSSSGPGQSETGATSDAPLTSGATTTGMSTSGGTEDPTGGGGCGEFLCPPDGGGGACDNWAQDCPEGQKCMPFADNGTTAWNSTKCVEVKPDKHQPGDECSVEGGAVSGIDTCDFGAMCWEVDPQTGIGTCVAQCTGSPEAAVCPLGGTCFVSNMGVLNLCLPLCDPLAQDCPGSGLCIPNPKNNEEFTCVLDASGEEGQAFDACEYINVCDKGLMCADTAFVGAGCDPASKGCCTPFCEFPGGPCPNPDQSCVQYYDPANPPFPNAEDIGVCGIPS